MKKAYIFIHGNLSQIPKINIGSSDIVVCADGAASYALEQGITPHVIIGDLDSISPEVTSQFQEGTTWKKFPREKDFTDAELAIQYALEQHVDELVILGLLGDRIDHMLSNIFHIVEVSNNFPCKIIEGDKEMYILRSKITLKGKKDDELSLIPLKGDCEGVTTDGLYYPLKNEMLPFGSTRGISNVFLGDEARVTVTSGLLLVVHRQLR